MAEHRVDVTDADLDRARRRAARHANDPVAKSVDYVRDLNLLIVHLSNGVRLALPIEQLQGLPNATPEQLQEYELIGGGTGISFPQIDEDFYVPALIEGVYGNRAWMASLAQKGGRARTVIKQLASRTNGRKGGRPKKTASTAT